MSLENDLKQIDLILCQNKQGHEAIREILQRIRDRDRSINRQATIEEKNNNENTPN